MQYVNCLSSTPFFVKHHNRQLTQLSGSRTVSHGRGLVRNLGLQTFDGRRYLDVWSLKELVSGAGRFEAGTPCPIFQYGTEVNSSGQGSELEEHVCFEEASMWRVHLIRSQVAKQ